VRIEVERTRAQETLALITQMRQSGALP
jgi:hypothetical protein